MNSRERFLAVVLIVAMAAVAGGFFGYQFVLKPLHEKSDQEFKLRDEVADLEEKREAIELQQMYFERNTRKKSLPLDVTFAKREYERLLSGMVAQAKLRDPVITPHEPDSKTNVPTIGVKKVPLYTKLTYDVQVTGDMLELVDFLYSFYRQPLLQQVRKIDITKPTRGGRGAAAEDRTLEIKLSIEALVLDRAEDRRQLLYTVPGVAFAAGGAGAASFAATNVETGLGTPFTATGVLARGDDVYSRTSSEYEYHRIAGKNIFFDPIRVSESKPDLVKEDDLGPNLCLNHISHSNGKSVAMIFDRMNKNDYEIEMDQRGNVKVTQYSYKRVQDEEGVVNSERVKNRERPYLQFGSEEGGNLRKYVVQRILEDEILLEPYEPDHVRLMNGAVTLGLGGTAKCVFPGRLCVWRVGQMLTNEDPKKAMRELTYNWNKQQEMLRPAAVVNEGEETVTLSGDPDVPVEKNRASFGGGKKGDFKGRFGKKGSAAP